MRRTTTNQWWQDESKDPVPLPGGCTLLGPASGIGLDTGYGHGAAAMQINGLVVETPQLPQMGGFGEPSGAQRAIVKGTAVFLSKMDCFMGSLLKS